MTLTVVTFLWGSKYSASYVDRLGEGLRRHMDAPYRFVVVTDYPRQFGRSVAYQEKLRNPELTKVQGCFARLRLFDPIWQRELMLLTGDRILVLDLDLIITGKLAPLVQRPEPFVILQGVNNPKHPCPYTGSIWLTTAGYRPDVWSTFSLAEAQKLPRYAFPDDQGWLHAKIPDAAAYTDKDGCYAFSKGPWQTGHGLPDNARIVAFPGSRDPAMFVHLPWVRLYWLGIA